MKKILLIVTSFAALACTVNASSIKIVMNHGDTTVDLFDTTPDGTVVSAGTNGTETWNQVSRNGGDGLVFSGKALALSDGTASGATLAVNAGYSAFNASSKTNDDDIMMIAWYGFNDSETMTVSGLSSDFTTEGYTVTIYGDTGFARTMDYTIGGTTKTFDGDVLFDGTFTEGVDFVTFTGLTGTDFTITGGGSGRAAINGLEIVAIPEPATLGIVAAVGGGMLFIRRRLMI